MTHPPHLAGEQREFICLMEEGTQQWGLPAPLGVSLLCPGAGCSWPAGCSVRAPLTRSFRAQSRNPSDACASCICTSHASSFLEMRP